MAQVDLHHLQVLRVVVAVRSRLVLRGVGALRPAVVVTAAVVTAAARGLLATAAGLGCVAALAVVVLLLLIVVLLLLWRMLVRRVAGLALSAAGEVQKVVASEAVVRVQVVIRVRSHVRRLVVMLLLVVGAWGSDTVVDGHGVLRAAHRQLGRAVVA